MTFAVVNKASARQRAAAQQGRLLSLAQAAEILGISVWTLRDLIGAGELKAVRPPGVRRVFIDRRDIEKAPDAWKS